MGQRKPPNPFTDGNRSGLSAMECSGCCCNLVSRTAGIQRGVLLGFEPNGLLVLLSCSLVSKRTNHRPVALRSLQPVTTQMVVASSLVSPSSRNILPTDLGEWEDCRPTHLPKLQRCRSGMYILQVVDPTYPLGTSRESEYKRGTKAQLLHFFFGGLVWVVRGGSL